MTTTNIADAARPTGFDTALTGDASQLELGDGRRLPLHPQRWQHCDDAGDRWLLDHCHGPTIDLGCGPGRLVAGLLAHGIPALGVDESAHAIARCRGRGAPAMRRDLFAALPAEGHWQHVLLADGNIGIGGDPVTLLRRARTLLDTAGSVLVETTPTCRGLWHGTARVHDRDHPAGPWFPWALVGADAIGTIAHLAGLRVVAGTSRRQDRYFAQLGN